VCIATAFLRATNQINDSSTYKLTQTQLDIINKYAFTMEQIMHGTPSGIDNSVSTYGGAISFIKGQSIKHLQKVPILRLLITNTKVPGRNTKALVAGVRQRLENSETSEIIKSLIDQIQQVSIESTILLDKMYENSKETNLMKDLYIEFEKLIDKKNQILLNGIGVGHEKLTKVVEIANKYGLHTKLTGAGGGGCAYTLLKGINSSSLIKELEAQEFDCYELDVGGNGVLVHKEFQFPSFTTLAAKL